MFTLICIRMWQLKWNIVISNLNWRVYYTFLVSHGYPCDKLPLGKNTKRIKIFLPFQCNNQEDQDILLLYCHWQVTKSASYNKIEVKTWDRKSTFLGFEMKISETPPTQQFLQRWHFENSGVCSEAKQNWISWWRLGSSFLYIASWTETSLREHKVSQANRRKANFNLITPLS